MRPQIQYVTEDHIRQEVAGNLMRSLEKYADMKPDERRQLARERAKAAGIQLAAGTDVEKWVMLGPKAVETPEFEAWVKGRVEEARGQRRLLTRQQYADLRARRGFTEGDRARYVGPDRDEKTDKETTVKRPHGQMGVIEKIDVRPGANPVITFMPDVPAILADGEVVRLVTAEWIDLERVPT